VTECNGFERPSRAMLLSALSVSHSLFVVARCTMRSVSIRALPRRCNLRSGLCLRTDQVRNLRSRLMLDPKRIRTTSAVAISHFRVAAVPAALHLLFFSFALSLCVCSVASLFKLLLPPALGVEGCCREVRRVLHSPTGVQKHRELSTYGHHSPFL
jgi:hypothetical protein